MGDSTTPVGATGKPAFSLEELMERATQPRGPERVEGSGSIDQAVARALLSFDRGRAVAHSAGRFALRPTGTSSQPLPEGAPIEEHPVAVPAESGGSMATGGTGGTGSRETTVTVDGRSFPVVITRGDASAPEGYVSVRRVGHQTLWASPDVASQLSAAIENARGGFVIAQ
jgi:hypothetical protein